MIKDMSLDSQQYSEEISTQGSSLAGILALIEWMHMSKVVLHEKK
jgi:hypothetical protein